MRAGLRHTVAAALALAWVACAVPAAGQVDRYLGVAVAGVRVELEGRQVVEPDVVSLVSVGVGRPFSMTDVRESLRLLFALGRFDDVEADVEPGPGAERVPPDGGPRHPARRVRGSTGVPSGDLERVVTDRHGRAPPLRVSGRARDRRTWRSGHFRRRHALVGRPLGRASLVFDRRRAAARIGAARRGRSTAARPPRSALRLAPGRP
jgi:hypothetical protein